jgi:hypothetical protein
VNADVKDAAEKAASLEAAASASSASKRRKKDMSASSAAADATDSTAVAIEEDGADGAGRFNGGEEEAAFQSNSSVAHTVVVHPIGDTLAALKKLTCNPRKPIKEPSADADNVVLVEQGFALDPSVAQPCWKCKKPGHKCPKKAQKARKRRGGRRSAK